MGGLHKLYLVAVFQELLNDAPFVVRLRSYKHSALLLPATIDLNFFPNRRLRQPALAQATLRDVSIDPVAKLHCGALPYRINRLVEWCEAFHLDAVNAVLQKFVVRIAVADEIEMSIQIDNIVRIDVLVNNALLLGAHGSIIEADLLPAQNRLFNGVDSLPVWQIICRGCQVQVNRGSFSALLEMLELLRW